jgi:hypothetical protein
LRIFDVSNPAKPSELYNVDTTNYAYGVAVGGSYAYLAAYSDGLRIIQLYDSPAPKEVGAFTALGYARGVAVSGNYALVADTSRSMRIINVSNPAAPVETGMVSTDDAAYNVVISDQVAYLANASQGLRLINWENPAAPAEVGFFDISSGAVGVAVASNYAYVADGYNGLQIVNVLNPAAPVLLSTANTPGNASHAAISGNYAYVADWGSGLRIINKTDPAAPSETGYVDTPGDAYQVAVVEPYAYVADWGGGLRIINISSPALPVETGFFDTSGYAGGVAVSGSLAYVADDTYGARVINKANPAAPFEAAYADTAGVAYDVAVSGRYLYVADGANGLRIVYVPIYFSGPNEKEDNDTLATANGQLYSGQIYQGNPDDANDYFELTTYAAGTISLDLTLPAGTTGQLMLYYKAGASPVATDASAPFQINYSGSSGAYQVRVYVTGGFSTTSLYNLRATYPTALSELGGYNTPGVAQAVKITSGYAYVADGGSGLRVINTSTPSTPSEVGFYDTPGSGHDVAVAGNVAYLADGDCGLMILRMCTEPAAPVLVAPADASTTSTDNTPTFDWNAASSANEYQIQIDDNSNFTSPVASVTVTTTEYTPAAPLVNATYYWRVRGRNTASGCALYGAYSSMRKLTVAVPPEPFKKAQPANGALGLPSDLVPFGWGASSWATYYEFCFDTSNDNTCTTWINVGTNTSFYYEGGFDYATMYFWQARACNTLCTEADGGTWWSFTTNDAYEPDNTSTQAPLAQPGTTRHSITPDGDVDWIRFTLAEEKAVFLQTWGSEGSDTVLSLFNVGLGLIESNDNWGSNNFSYLDRLCNVDPLPAGDYYVKVEENGNNREIPIYHLRLITWGCKIYAPAVMREPIFYFDNPFEFEPNDSPAQANGPLRPGWEIQGYPDDENDYFSILTKNSGTITVDLSDHTGGGVQLLVYYQSAGNTVAIDNSAPYALSFSGAPGTYYVRIYTASGYNTTTPYRLMVTYP